MPVRFFDRLKTHTFYFVEPIQWKIYLYVHGDSLLDQCIGQMRFVGSGAFISKAKESISWIDQRDSKIARHLMGSSLTFVEEPENPFPTHLRRPRFTIMKCMTAFDPEGMGSQLVLIAFLWTEISRDFRRFPSDAEECRVLTIALGSTLKWYHDHHVDQRAIEELKHKLEQVQAGNVG